MARKLGKSTGKKLGKLPFKKAVTIDKARKDIGAKFAGTKNGTRLFSVGKSVGSAGVVFTGKELARAKTRAIKLRL